MGPRKTKAKVVTMESMTAVLHRAKLTTALMGVSSLVLGLVMFVSPLLVAFFATMALGAILAASGVATLVGYFRNREVSSGVDAAFGAVELLFGILVLLTPAFYVNWLVVMVGVFMLFSGVGDLIDARALAKQGASFSWAATVLAVLTIAFGVLVIWAPFAFLDAMFMIAGFGLVFNGITELVTAFKM